MTFEQLYTRFRELKAIVTDSRKIVPNCIFWALKGENFDANDFVEEVLEKGAALVVTSRKDLEDNPKIYYTEDTLLCLQDLAKHHRLQLKAKILGITGTNGKTTTKELIHAVFATACKVKSTQGNLNNHIGVPLTLLSFDEDTDFGVVEMGANHPGEIKSLCEIAEPNFGIITNIGIAHLEGFGSLENLVKTKAELYDYIINKKGTIFQNSDNKILKEITNYSKIITYGTNSDVDTIGKIIDNEPFLKIELENNCIIQSNLIGEYNFENILAAVCVGNYFKIKDDLIKNAIENYFPKNNRSQVIEKGTNRIISDAYNANPTSMDSALNNFMNLNVQNKIIVLGDMFELGSYAFEEHYTIIEKLIHYINNNNSSAEVHIVGHNFYEIHKTHFTDSKIKSYKTTDELIKSIQNKTFQNTWILIKGSRGMKMETIIEYFY